MNKTDSELVNSKLESKGKDDTSSKCINEASETKEVEVIVLDNIEKINDKNKNSLSRQHSQSISNHSQFCVQDKLPCHDSGVMTINLLDNNDNLLDLFNKNTVKKA